ncbi:hypothetical protein P154DRAFT_521678 [Amniculicola lignicola CBS 123094]|uniref:Uncharacterized protein n=1 Tax=Amniculicola lignicola CBS 123094 TaxID=1392246 RepID=A0A6A5WIY4_9PLEO|nr:hypothetical protein P154DRAFT_521678 [Amniculicola lignicola CBS 123094]
MALNWITHTISLTPSIKTEDDIIHTPLSQIASFFNYVYQEFLHGTTTQAGCVLPVDLYKEACTASPDVLAAAIERVIREGGVMDCGWLEDYWTICELVSAHMGGYPKVCLKEWRGIRNAVAGFISAQQAGEQRKEEKAIVPFRFLDLPEEVRERVYSFLIPTGRVAVSDWAIGCLPDTVVKRTEYDVPDVNGDTRRSTYLVQTPNLSAYPYLNIMLSNRSIFNATANLLYDARIEFRGTASGTLAFLHDHMKSLSRIKKISLKYTTTSISKKFLGCSRVDSKLPTTLKTNILIWRKVIRHLSRWALNLEDVELVVDRHFWEKASWQAGAKAIFASENLCENSRPKRDSDVSNFLAEVSRLSGVNFRLVIEGMGEDKEKNGFRKEMEKYMSDEMQKRPYTAERSPACSCKKRLLSEACAWGDGKRRRS